MDIANAMQDAQPATGSSKCILARRLDSIPEDTPGRDELAAAVTNVHDWPATTVARVFHNLELPLSASAVRDHRRRGCRCYLS